MLLAIVRVPAPPTPEAAAELERRFAERLPQVAHAPGFAGFELLRPTEAGGPYLSVSRWATRADFDAWRHSTYNAG
ncbi:MAG: antibiotic biosynthesis monooxygenase, partial [Chloroflexota bacterium]|nr:antibiotic biosynthesis monooxygenase [Chloroflexota bacterium]